MLTLKERRDKLCDKFLETTNANLKLQDFLPNRILTNYELIKEFIIYYLKN
jgi:hypothetical protein